MALSRAENEQRPNSSSSPQCDVDPHASETCGAETTRSGNCSSKRSTRPPEGEGAEMASSKRSRTVVYPFTVVKPGGVDGGATLADINERILTRPARPVRHPVGEFACAPRALAAGDRPAPSGKNVAGFTTLYTAGKGTVTIIRTTG